MDLVKKNPNFIKNNYIFYISYTVRKQWDIANFERYLHQIISLILIYPFAYLKKVLIFLQFSKRKQLE